MANLNMTTFHVVVSVYRFIKIWNSSQFSAEFLNGQLEALNRDNCDKYNLSQPFLDVFS